MTLFVDHADAVHNRLNSDVELLTLLTGGVYLLKNLIKGVSPTGLAAAYTTTTPKTLKPCSVIRGRETVPFGGLRDKNTQYQSNQQVIEVYFYRDASGAISTLEQAGARAYELLNLMPIINSFEVELVNWAKPPREAMLGDAHVLRYDYAVVGQSFVS